MKTRNIHGLFVAVAVGLLILGSVSAANATEEMHFDGSGRETPWANCTLCHGADLLGTIGPSCMSCHNDFVSPNPPATGHHKEGRDDPMTNCTTCHGQDLTGNSIVPSCTTCHDEVWGGPGNLPPVVDAGGPYSGTPGQEILFDASGTVDPDGDALTYLWNFGDGTPPPFFSSDPTITHAFENAGTYTVTVTVTDTVNQPAFVQVQVVVADGGANLPPNVDPGGPYEGLAGQSVQFSGAGTTDPDGDSLQYEWDFGDGSSVQSGQTVTHVYQNSGDYLAVLTVRDGVNDPVSESVDVAIAAPNFPPSADAGGPYSGVVDQAVQFDGSGSSDPEGDGLDFRWSFGDGSATQSGQTVTHTYQNVGTYVAVLTVDDGVNDPVSANVEVVIDDGTTPPPPPAGENDWQIKLPLVPAEGTLTINSFAGILLINESFPSGSSFGLGFRTTSFIAWMDSKGALFFGNENRDAGTMMGFVFSFMGGGDTIWMAEQAGLQDSASVNGLLDGIFFDLGL